MFMRKTVLKVFIGCCASASLMEILMARAPQCANLITFLQFFFISFQGFIFTTKCGQIKPKIPIKQYALLVTLFFITSVANNYVYTLHVPSTLHMIIRSATSPASLLVSWYMKNRVPKLSNAIGSVLITIGVAMALYGGATVAERNEGTFVLWCIGVCILLASLFTGAFTGLQQEILFAKYGKHPDEMLFYTHAIPLLLFFGISHQLMDTATKLTWDTWIIVALNIVSQFYCTHSVHELATKETSVTVTLILTLRKFASLMLSSLVFKSYLTVYHVIGSLFVFIGMCIYFNFFQSRKQVPVKLKSK